jgi:hypothetical protein
MDSGISPWPMTHDEEGDLLKTSRLRWAIARAVTVVSVLGYRALIQSPVVILSKKLNFTRLKCTIFVRLSG